MELRDIEYFAIVAEHRHLGRASEALGLTQPALSKSLRRLEQSLQTKLVKRTPKGVELTTEGCALLSRVRELRLSLQDVAREIADLSQGRVGNLLIGAGPTLAEDILPAAFAALLKGAPRLRLKVSVSDNDLMVPALHNGEVDIIVNYIPAVLPEGLVQMPLIDDEFVVCASTNHRLTRHGRVTIADLVEEQWALTEQTLGSQASLRRAFQDRGLPLPQVALETRSVRLVLRSVASSNLLTFTSRHVVEQAASRYRLAVLHVRELESAWRRPVGVIYRKGGYLSPPPSGSSRY